MSLYQDWVSLYENQTDETFVKFWEEYSGAETRIYSELLSGKDAPFSFTISEAAEKFSVSPELIMGFLDGINDSLTEPIDYQEMDADSSFSLVPDWEKLYFNMLDAHADYLYTLPEWNDILDEETRAAITKKYRRSKTVVKGKKIGRNEPCPCGSGKKYKNCCGRAANE